MTNQTGTLFIVATPIGNLNDISPRALDTLKSVDLIVAEDTRHSKRLLNHFGITTKLASLHRHNESTKSEFLLSKITQGDNLALISDAGTPLISDPGYPIVNLARSKNLDVIPIPGACALITALCAAGLPTDRFCFEGFLPAKQQSRINKLDLLKTLNYTVCFYEAPHRILDSLKDMLAVLGRRQIVVAKELTKSFERFFSGSIAQVIEQLNEEPDVIRGEFVIVVEAAPDREESVMEIENHMKILLKSGVAMKTASGITAELLGCKKKQAYNIGLALSNL